MTVRPPDLSSRTKPFPHQLEATGFILGKPAVAIFDEQGLGKTKIVLDAILRELETSTIDSALVVCKAGLVPMWQDEIRKHTNLQGMVLTGTRSQIGRRYLVFSSLYITSYSVLHRELDTLKGLMGIRRFSVVLDESHTIKNPEARVTKTVLAIASMAKQRIILTGTPVANYPEDLWSQFYFLDGGHSLGSDFDLFRLTYHLGQGAGRRAVSEDNLSAITSRIRPIAMRRTKLDVLELPDKSFATDAVRLTGLQARMYKQVRDELRLELLGPTGDREVRDIENALERLLRLVQVASNPKLVDAAYSDVPAKFRKLDTILRGVLKRNEKAVVWSQFVENVQTLRRIYRSEGAVEIHGGVSIDRRHDAVTRFQEDPSCRLVFAVPAAAREGLTLTAANNAIYVDRGFNLVDYIQSQDRIHRIGQTEPCQILKLVAQGTVDDFVEEVLSRKQAIADGVQSGVEGSGRELLVRASELKRVLGGDIGG